MTHDVGALLSAIFGGWAARMCATPPLTSSFLHIAVEMTCIGGGRPESRCTPLPAGGAGFAGFFPHVLEFRFGIVDGFLPGGDVVAVLAVVIRVLLWVAEAVAGVAVVVGGAHAALALQDIQLALEDSDLFALRRDLVSPLLIEFGLLFG